MIEGEEEVCFVYSSLVTGIRRNLEGALISISPMAKDYLK